MLTAQSSTVLRTVLCESSLAGDGCVGDGKGKLCFQREEKDEAVSAVPAE